MNRVEPPDDLYHDDDLAECGESPPVAFSHPARIPMTTLLMGPHSGTFEIGSRATSG